MDQINSVDGLRFSRCRGDLAEEFGICLTRLESLKLDGCWNVD
jgi:hypothetical protein